MVKPQESDEVEATETDGINEIDRLLGRVEESEKQFTREEGDVEIPIVAGVEAPTQAQIDRHEATHIPPKRWCAACREGIAIRDQQ